MFSLADVVFMHVVNYSVTKGIFSALIVALVTSYFALILFWIYLVYLQTGYSRSTGFLSTFTQCMCRVYCFRTVPYRSFPP